MQVTLSLIGTKANKKQVRVTTPATIGRSREATLTIGHPMISRKHSELFEQGGRLMVRDLGSLNGTLVGGEAVGEAVLSTGDEFTIGPITFRVQLEGALAEPAPTAEAIPIAGTAPVELPAEAIPVAQAEPPIAEAIPVAAPMIEDEPIILGEPLDAPPVAEAVPAADPAPIAEAIRQAEPVAEAEPILLGQPIEDTPQEEPIALGVPITPVPEDDTPGDVPPAVAIPEPLPYDDGSDAPLPIDPSILENRDDNIILLDQPGEADGASQNGAQGDSKPLSNDELDDFLQGFNP